jgi:hypothetical protein
MSERIVERIVNRMQRRQSRRGFLATCGKVSLAIGAALAGVHLTPRRTYADPCCGGNPCGNCPPTPGCPPGTSVQGVPYVCCDTGHVGSTNTVHQCWVCTGGPGGPCECEYDTGTPCP